MKKRPTSITVICWLQLIGIVVGLASIYFALKNPMARELMSRSLIPIPVQYSMMYFNVMVTIISSIGMLMGRNWARMFYVFWTIISWGINIAATPISMSAMFIPGLLVVGIIVFFLFRPKANRYFSGMETEDGTQNN